MRKLHELTWMLAATLVCGASVFTSCTSDNDDNPVPESGASGELVGQWYSDVSGATYAAWTYGKAWQQMEFNADGTGTTSIYYLPGGTPGQVPVSSHAINHTFSYSRQSF